VYKAPAPAHAPPAVGYNALGDYRPVPTVLIFRDLPSNKALRDGL
jgi:hypothetical protein